MLYVKKYANSHLCVFYELILAWCRIYVSWKTALISLVKHICVANPSISLIGPGETYKTLSGQDELKKDEGINFISICIVMHPVSNLYDISTHWPHGVVEVISQANFSISFFKLISWALPVELVSGEQITFDNRPTLVLVIAWCHQATYHYLSQCWSRIIICHHLALLSHK